MRGIIKISFVIFMFTSNQSLYSQYEGLDSNRRQIKAALKQKDSFADNSINLIEMRFSGLDFSVFGNGSTYQLELAPYTGYQFNERLYLAGGISGSVITMPTITGNGLISTNIAAFGFLRIPVNSFFLDAEYRIQNSVTSYEPRTREWFGTSIIGIGYLNEDNFGSYILLGVALNPKYYFSSPLGPFIYRFGFRF